MKEQKKSISIIKVAIKDDFRKRWPLVLVCVIGMIGSIVVQYLVS